MSSLTKDTTIEYTNVYYDENRNFITEGGSYDSEEYAIEMAQEEIAYRILETNKYVYAVVEKRIVPIYR